MKITGYSRKPHVRGRVPSSGTLQAAAAYHREPDGSYRAYGIVVLTATVTGIARLVVFADPGLFGWFGLPQTHD